MHLLRVGRIIVERERGNRPFCIAQVDRFRRFGLRRFGIAQVERHVLLVGFQQEDDVVVRSGTQWGARLSQECARPAVRTRLGVHRQNGKLRFRQVQGRCAAALNKDDHTPVTSQCPIARLRNGRLHVPEWDTVVGEEIDRDLGLVPKEVAAAPILAGEVRELTRLVRSSIFVTKVPFGSAPAGHEGAPEAVLSGVIMRRVDLVGDQ